MNVKNVINKYYTSQEVAELIGVQSYTNISRRAKAGKILGAVKFGNTWAIPKSWVENEREKRGIAYPLGNRAKDEDNVVKLQDYISAVDVADRFGIHRANISYYVEKGWLDSKHTVLFGNVLGISKEYLETRKETLIDER